MNEILIKHSVILIFLFFLFSCASVAPPPQPEPVPITTPAPEEPPSYKLSFAAAGDNLIHITMLNSSLDNGAYNFYPFYSEVKSIISQADIALINQETVMGGGGFGYSGYPRFNTPSSMAATLVDLGFTVISHANNHVLDMGEAGILATLDIWDSFPGISCLGIRRTEDKQPAIIVRNNISLGFLAYTFSTNGIPLPKNKPWMVSMTNRETMAAEIDALRPQCDFLIVSVHWGDEYAQQPNQFQLSLANFFAEHDVDLIIGHHPHVLQRAEYIKRPDGKQTLCFFSLGNFVSNQDKKEMLLGALACVMLIKKDDKVFINDAGLIPVLTHIENGYVKTKVIPLFEYSDDLMKTHRLYSKDRDWTMNFFYSYLTKMNTKLYMYNPFAKGAK